jgi:hypothetical protein
MLSSVAILGEGAYNANKIGKRQAALVRYWLQDISDAVAGTWALPMTPSLAAIAILVAEYGTPEQARRLCRLLAAADDDDAPDPERPGRPVLRLLQGGRA